jgi:formate dehydrogenase (coenzyme F420) beta subunit
MNTTIPVQNGDTLSTLQNFLKRFLEAGLVDAMLLPMRTPHGVVAPALVSDPQMICSADPLAPVLSLNSATLAGKLSVREPRPRLAAVMRACELRALVELVKLQQADLKDLTLIALDCAGTYSVPNYQKKSADGGEAPWKGLFAGAESSPAQHDPGLRAACQVCEQPVYAGADVSIHLFGSDLEKEIHLEVSDEIATALELQPAEPNGRAPLVEALVTARTDRREAEFAALRTRLEGEEGLGGVFAACIRCHNCMTVCPICYCKTCVFKSPIFDHEPTQYMNWTRQKGAMRMPSDTVLFHLTRLNHMVLSCVGCGMCTEACPSELPVGMAFRAIGQRVQSVFDYAPGRSLADELPLVTFKADEWNEVGE